MPLSMIICYIYFHKVLLLTFKPLLIKSKYFSLDNSDNSFSLPIKKKKNLNGIDLNCINEKKKNQFLTIPILMY